MRSTLALLASLATLALGCGAFAQAPPKAPAAVRETPAAPGLDPVRLEAFLDGWMADAMAREHVPGAAVAVVQNGQVILKKGYGFADLERGVRVDPDRTLFRLGSISKTFTWILVMRDVELGRMRLDRPINLYLPEKARVRDEGRRRDVTIAHLMNHTGGFEDRALGQLFERDPSRIRPLELYLRQERPARVHSAGAVASYSNYGAALAGQAAAFVTGKTFERRVEDEIAGPLGMTRTTFREPRPDRRGLPAPMPQRLRGDLASGYTWTGGGFSRNAYEYIGQVAPAGSASSTAGDMSRYMMMMLNEGAVGETRLFSPATANGFREPTLATPPGVNGWAHGFITFLLPGGHKGFGHLGHTLAFKANMTLVPDVGLGVFVAANSASSERLTDILPEALLAQFYAKPHAPRSGSRELAQRAGMYEGLYLGGRRAYGGLEGFVTAINAAATVKVTPDGRLLVERAGETTAWTPEGPLEGGRFIGVDNERRLAFDVVEGRAASFRTAQNTETLARAPLHRRPDVLAGLAGLTAAASVFTLAGIALRNRRDLREHQTQGRAGLVQNIQAGLWLAALGLFGAWGAGTGDVERVMYDWPNALVVLASACALVAALMTLATAAALPSVWRGGRRVDSWPGRRKVFFTITVLIYAAFSLALLLGGALEPWSA